MQRASILKVWMRSMRVVIDVRYCTTSVPHTVKPQQQRGNSEFVKRRRVYEKDLHRLRISFASEHAEEESRVEEAKKVDQKSLEGVAEARVVRKREKSIARQAAHLTRLKAVEEKKKGRMEYKRRDWEKRWSEVIAGRVAVADLLAEHATDWFTEETIDDDVERVIDEFFVVAAQQKRELKEMVEKN